MISLRDSSFSGHGGFSASIDPSSARRQLQVSVGVVAVLCLAIAASLFALRSDHETQLGVAPHVSAFATSGTPITGG